MKRALLVSSSISVALFCLIGAALVRSGPGAQEGEYEIKMPLGLDEFALVIPEDNPMSEEKVELGRLLYFDRRLSVDNTISCASCHHPRHVFTDGQPVSTGVKGQKGGRSAPTVINRAFTSAQFWDGRAPSLEAQAKGPMVNPIEMGNPSHDVVVEKLKAIRGYGEWFQKVFGAEDLTIDHVVKAIAAFERTVLSGNSKFDQLEYAGDEKALSESAKRGLVLFRDKARCATCHGGFNFTDELYHNLGVGMEKPNPDLGRYEQSNQEKDKGAFKTPTLREITNTAPYMHDGRFDTLEEVIDFYDEGGIPNRYLDQEVKRLNLTVQEKKDLIEFLKSLEGEGWQQAKEPMKFPE